MEASNNTRASKSGPTLDRDGLMQYRILGPLEVHSQGRQVDVGSPKQRALLLLLLVNSNQPVSFDRLIDELWNGNAPTQPLVTLQSYVSNLRRALGAGRSSRASRRILLTRGRSYVVRVEPGELDAYRFEELGDGGRAALDRGDVELAEELLSDALGLWRGEALADVAGELFAQTEIARLDELRLAVTADRIDALLALGRHWPAVAELERLVAAHPLCERLRGQVMVALYRCGRQAEALRAYQELRSTLVEQLGIEPGLALQRLEHQILSQDSSLEWSPATGAAPRPAGEAIDDRGPYSCRFVGREPELARLEAALETVSSGTGRLVLVAGEAGIGKSRLVEELAARASTRGLSVVWGRCYEEGAAAFWPWREVVRSAADHAAPDIVAAALNASGSDIARVVPEVKALVSDTDAPPALDPEEARLRLYDALTVFFKRLTHHHPFVVVLEDVHWADPPSLQLLGFLAAHLRDSRLLVAVTYRDTEVEAASPLAACLASLARHPIVERVVLPGLSPHQVACLVAEALPAPPSEALVANLYARTHGNPFFLTQLVGLLKEQGDPNAADQRVLGAEIPLAVRDVIARRLARLPGDVRAMLEGAAVIGHGFRLGVLERALALERDDIVALVETALSARILAPDADSFDAYRFSHPLIQETLYKQTPAICRARLHAAVGDALEQLGTGQTEVIEVAHHFWKAAPVGRGDKALELALRAADHAVASLAYEQAEEHFERALKLLATQTPTPERHERELEILARQSALLTMTRGYGAPAVEAACRRALGLCRQVGGRAGLLPALWGLWSFSCVRADFDGARRLATQLFAEAERLDVRAFAVAAHQGLGVTSFHQGRLTEAHHHLALGAALSDELSDPGLAEVCHQDPGVACRSFDALVLWLMGDAEAAARASMEALAKAQRLDQPFSLAFAHFFRAWLAVLAKDAPTAAEHAEVSLALSRERGFRLFAAMAAILRGWASSQTHGEEPAWDDLEASVAACAQTGARMLRHFFLALMAEAQWRAGLDAAALASLDRALAEAQASGERFYEAEVHRLRGEVLARLSPQSAEEAERSLRRAVAVAEAQGCTALRDRAAQSWGRIRAG